MIVVFMTAEYMRYLLKLYSKKIDEYQKALDECRAVVVDLESQCRHTEDDETPAYDVNKPPHYRLCTICGFPPNRK